MVFVKFSYQKKYYLKNKSHTKYFETISKVGNQSSNNIDEDVDDCDHDIGTENCVYPSLCRGNLCGNLLAEYLQISHTL